MLRCGITADRRDRADERAADQLASEFLIPSAHLKDQLGGQIPIDAGALKRLSKAANVSPVMAACRLVNATEELGLQNAAVVFFKGGIERWRYAQGIELGVDSTAELLASAVACRPKLLREPNADGNTVVGSMIDAGQYQVLLIQLLAPNQAASQTIEENLRTLQLAVFGDDYKFQQSVAARLGVCKSKCKDASLDDAVGYFYDSYVGTAYTKSHAVKLRSRTGKEFVRLFLAKWFK